ncbi:MAG TPA: HNH endonuclease [Gemmatirosa sp.]|jgi:5-methylcytosine-specific restriction endonuclease McrA|nr:HNH endonuclease [Gemmatirosa sp.]
MPPRPFARSRFPRRHARSTLARTRGPELRERQQVASLCRKRALKQEALRDCARRCAYCATPLCLESATLDHVVPRAHGGPHVAGNVVAACGRCNRLKADLLPAEFFLKHPWAGENFVRYARGVHRTLKRHARRAVSLAYAA